MKYLLLVSHGGFVEGLKTSLATFVGDKMDQVIAVDLKNGKTAGDLVQGFRQTISGLTVEDSVIVPTDTVGGGLLTTACSILDELGKLDGAVILGGVNLPIAITSVVMKDMSEGDAFVQVVLSEVQVALQEFKVASDDEEDDI